MNLVSSTILQFSEIFFTYAINFFFFFFIVCDSRHSINVISLISSHPCTLDLFVLILEINNSMILCIYIHIYIFIFYYLIILYYYYYFFFFLECLSFFEDYFFFFFDNVTGSIVLGEETDGD